MKLMFIGKYPPIEGGESSKLYWLTKGLGEKGHNITVISNCQEIEEKYREYIPVDELRELKPKNVQLFSTNPLSNQNFIPYYNPFSEKLTSLALECINIEKPNLIIGWYLLPYAVAAHNVSRISGVPYLIQHAGSDIERLLPHDYLKTYLKHILTSADAILTYSSTYNNFFESLGCRAIEKHNVRISKDFSPFGEQSPLINKEKRSLLFLGKSTKYKGVPFLLESFKKIKSTDIHLYVIGQKDLREYSSLIDERVISLLPVPPWSIPKILRSVDLYIAPEYSFGVKSHTPRTPLEAILCGTKVLLSNEISSKSPYKNLKGFYTEIYPSNTEDFAKKIIKNLEEPLENSPSEEQKNFFEDITDFDTYLSDMEKIFAKYAK